MLRHAIANLFVLISLGWTAVAHLVYGGVSFVSWFGPLALVVIALYLFLDTPRQNDDVEAECSNEKLMRAIVRDEVTIIRAEKKDI